MKSAAPTYDKSKVLGLFGAPPSYDDEKSSKALLPPSYQVLHSHNQNSGGHGLFSRQSGHGGGLWSEPAGSSHHADHFGLYGQGMLAGPSASSRAFKQQILACHRRRCERGARNLAGNMSALHLRLDGKMGLPANLAGRSSKSEQITSDKILTCINQADFIVTAHCFKGLSNHFEQ